MIRLARPDEYPLLAAIEDAAAQAFKGTAMEFILAFPATPVEARAEATETSRIWASVDRNDRPVGFLEAEIFDGWLHIFELSVHPDWQHQGRARELIETAAAFARSCRLQRLSLTTDSEIAWNGPTYRRMGFLPLAVDEAPSWLAGIIEREIAIGFDPARRIAMVRKA